jgi:hypothetical protein
MNMKKCLVAAKPIEPSKELEWFFGPPPLIGNERLEEYLAFSSVIERAAKAADDICRILVRELVNIWWEIRRERLIKVEIIKQKQREAVANVGHTRADYEKERQLAHKMSTPRDEDDEPSMFRKKGSEPVEKKQEDQISSLAKVYLQDGSAIDGCDRRLSAFEFRRSALLREVERRNQIVVRNADKAASAFVDAEFTEAVD